MHLANGRRKRYQIKWHDAVESRMLSARVHVIRVGTSHFVGKILLFTITLQAIRLSTSGPQAQLSALVNLNYYQAHEKVTGHATVIKTRLTCCP